jgi:hypothetical protein
MQRSNVNNQRNRAGGSHQSNIAACRVVEDTEAAAAKDQLTTKYREGFQSKKPTRLCQILEF